MTYNPVGQDCIKATLGRDGLPVVERQRLMADKHIVLREAGKTPRGHQLYWTVFFVGDQQFTFGYTEPVERESADFMAQMFVQALDKLLDQNLGT